MLQKGLSQLQNFCIEGTSGLLPGWKEVELTIPFWRERDSCSFSTSCVPRLETRYDSKWESTLEQINVTELSSDIGVGD